MGQLCSVMHCEALPATSALMAFLSVDANAVMLSQVRCSVLSGINLNEMQRRLWEYAL
jgi:hypothetical protein